MQADTEYMCVTLSVADAPHVELDWRQASDRLSSFVTLLVEGPEDKMVEDLRGTSLANLTPDTTGRQTRDHIVGPESFGANQCTTAHSHASAQMTN